MKTIIKLIILTTTLAICIFSCSKNEDITEKDDVNQNEGENPKETPDGFALIDVKVVIPEASSLDVTKLKLVSYGDEFLIDTNGDTKAFIYPNIKNFVYLVNNEEKIIMMGFLDAENKEISIKSTALASLFFSLDMFIRPAKVKTAFINSFDNTPDVENYISEVETYFNTTPNLYENEAFKNYLIDFRNNLVKGKEAIDLTSKGILIKDRVKKSGLSIAQEGITSFSITNEWRRRSHAFVYKTAYKLFSDDSFTVEINDIVSEKAKANIEKPVGIPSGVTDVVGGVVTWAQDRGYSVVSTKTDQIALGLENNEKQAKYEVRIVGISLGFQDPNALTKEEFDKWQELMSETMFLDIVIPFITTFISLGDYDTDVIDFNPIVAVGNDILNSSPDALRALKNGELLTASKEFIIALLKNSATSDLFIGAIIEVLKNAGVKITKDTSKIVEKISGPITLVNFTLFTSDVLRQSTSMWSANQVEEWELIVGLGKVRITPNNPGVAVGKKRVLTAELFEDQGNQELKYEWRTTGEYGILQEVGSVGNNGTTIVTTSADIYFASENINPSTIPDNASDMVYVDVYTTQNNNDVLIAKDSTSIKIYPSSYVIKPNGITIEGDNRLKLKVEDNNGNPLEASLISDFYIEWQSSEKHGFLERTNNSFDIINKDNIIYNCTDTDVESGVENVSAKIYRKSKSTGEVFFVDETSASINVKNEENVRYFYLPVEYDIWSDSTGGGYGYAVFFQKAPVENAKRYELRVKELKFGNNSTSFVNSSIAWNEGDTRYLVDGSYRYTTYTGSGPNSARADAETALGTLEGYAELKVTLNP